MTEEDRKTPNPFIEYVIFLKKKPTIKVTGTVFEFLGTFALCFLGGLAAYSGPLYAAFGHGLVLALFIFLGAKYDSGIFNPAVSLGLIIS